jgi:hypothetical protein
MIKEVDDNDSDYIEMEMKEFIKLDKLELS